MEKPKRARRRKPDTGQGGPKASCSGYPGGQGVRSDPESDALCGAVLFGFALGASEAVDLQLRGALGRVADREARSLVGQVA